MKVHTIRGVIRGVPAHWRRQYSGYGEEAVGKDGRSFADTGRALAALDLEKATPADVARIIGNDTWTELQCAECGKNVGAVVEVGFFNDDPHESSTVLLCSACLAAAKAALSRATGES